MHYKYCPECGQKLIDKEAGDDGLVPYCTRCETYWFDSFASCIIVLVANEQDEIALLTQPHLSTIHKTFVSGYITPGENAEECACREVKEELGIQLEKLEYAGTYWFEKRGQLMHGFIGYAKKQDFSLSSEVQKAEWTSSKEARDYFFPERPGNTMHALYRIYLKQKEAYYENHH